MSSNVDKCLFSLGNTMGIECTVVKTHAQFSSYKTFIKFLVNGLNELKNNADNKQSVYKGQPYSPPQTLNARRTITQQTFPTPSPLPALPEAAT